MGSEMCIRDSLVTAGHETEKSEDWREAVQRGREWDRGEEMIAAFSGFRVRKTNLARQFAFEAANLYETRGKLVASYHRKTSGEDTSPKAEQAARESAEAEWQDRLTGFRKRLEATKYLMVETGLSEAQADERLRGVLRRRMGSDRALFGEDDVDALLSDQLPRLIKPEKALTFQQILNQAKKAGGL